MLPQSCRWSAHPQVGAHFIGYSNNTLAFQWLMLEQENSCSLPKEWYPHCGHPGYLDGYCWQSMLLTTMRPMFSHASKPYNRNYPHFRFLSFYHAYISCHINSSANKAQETFDWSRTYEWYGLSLVPCHAQLYYFFRYFFYTHHPSRNECHHDIPRSWKYKEVERYNIPWRALKIMQWPTVCQLLKTPGGIATTTLIYSRI